VRDVGVIERGERFRLPLETCDAIRIGGEGLRQDLDRDVTVEFGVAGAVDLAHSTFADLRKDFVLL
jgi:hypothetical protein